MAKGWKVLRNTPTMQFDVGQAATDDDKYALAARSRQVGRNYIHLVMPSPDLDDQILAIFDVAVCQVDHWRPAPGVSNAAVLVRRWSRPDAVLTMVVLSWFPLLVTVGNGVLRGAPVRRSRFPHNNRKAVRQAIQRISQAAVRNGGRIVADHELEYCLAVSKRRWAAAAQLEQILTLHQQQIQFRQCASCERWSGYEAAHCQYCGHRFSSSEDMDRDKRSRAAEEVLSNYAQQLDDLTRGKGIFPDWPRPDAIEKKPGIAVERAMLGVRNPVTGLVDNEQYPVT